MVKETRRSLRCPVCERGRIADVPAGAALSQYRLVAMKIGDPADLITKCPKCGQQISIVILHHPPLHVADAVCNSSEVRI